MKKMFKTILAVVALAIIATMPSCQFNCKKGSGNQISQTRNVNNFSEIEISGEYKLIIKQDTNYGLKITADDNLMQYIKTDVSGNRLKVYTSRNICSSGQFVVNVGLKDLTALETSGAIEAVSDGKLTVKNLSLHLSGASNIDFDINADQISSEGSGLTKITLKGQASSHTVDFSGSATLDALDFVVAKYHIESSGTSHCKINVLNDLSISSSGMSDIQYRGNPSNVNNDKSGISTLQKIN